MAETYWKRNPLMVREKKKKPEKMGDIPSFRKELFLVVPPLSHCWQMEFRVKESSFSVGPEPFQPAVIKCAQKYSQAWSPTGTERFVPLLTVVS